MYGPLKIDKALSVRVEFQVGCEYNKHTKPTAIKLEKNGNNLIHR
jgi:hypothetical protein